MERKSTHKIHLAILIIALLAFAGCGNNETRGNYAVAESLEARAASGYHVDVTTIGLVGELELKNNLNDTPVSITNGEFCLGNAYEDSDPYSYVIVNQPNSQICTIFNGEGTIPGADVRNVRIECLFKIDSISKSVNEEYGNSDSYSSSLSEDGRYIAFESASSNLVTDDYNYSSDIFVHDRMTNQTTLVSIASDGTQGNSNSYAPAINAIGTHVVFVSTSNNLVAGDNNSSADIFVHHLLTGETTRVSVASDGTQATNFSSNPVISSEGRYIAFESKAMNIVGGIDNNKLDVFMHDSQTGETTLVSVASDGTRGRKASKSPSISADGRYVAFESTANRLVVDDLNYSSDIFVHDRQTGETTRVSVASDGTEGDYYSFIPSISGDGRYIAFISAASNLVQNDFNYSSDIFVHDRQTGETTRESVASDGTEGDFYSWAPSISADGKFVAFESESENLVQNDTNYSSDIFVHNRQTGETTRLSVAEDGTQGDAYSYLPVISADGKYVAFESDNTNLVSGDFNYNFDIFVSPVITGNGI